MAPYKHQLGFYDTVEATGHVNIGVHRALSRQQSRYCRRLGHLEQKILISSIIIIFCFVLGASTYIFLSRYHFLDAKVTLDNSFEDEFLANVPRIVTTPQLKITSNCDMKLLNSTTQLVQPLESKKFARFSLSYTEKEEKPDGVDHWEPRFAGHQSLKERENSFLISDQKINCGFVKGPKEYSSTGFDLDKDDYIYLNKCHIVVVSCIFGNTDRLKSPFENVISHSSRKTVCFVIFMDDKTLLTITSEGQIPNKLGFIGIWKVVVVKNLPYMDMRRVGKIPKLLPHRLFPSAKYSIWVDGKLRLQHDPLLLLERFLWRKGHEYAISNHYVRHCVWEEVERNKVLKKVSDIELDRQLQFYQADGLKRFNASDPKNLLPSNIPEASLLIRAHTPMSNMFSCLWFNEVDRFTSRDQLSFIYTYRKFIERNPDKKFYLDMFKDCERKQIVKLYDHRYQEKHNTTKNAEDNP